jgi:hypothetical protein
MVGHDRGLPAIGQIDRDDRMIQTVQTAQCAQGCRQRGRDAADSLAPALLPPCLLDERHGAKTRIGREGRAFHG